MNAHKSYKKEKNKQTITIGGYHLREGPLDFKQKFLIYTYIFNRNV